MVLPTATEIETFEKDGVVRLRGVISTDVAQSLGDALDQLGAHIRESATGYDMTRLRHDIFETSAIVADEGAARQHDVNGLAHFIRMSGAPALLEPAANSQPEGRFILDTSTWLRDPVIRKLALDSELPKIAAQLLRATKINFCDDQIFIKEPRTRERTALHQDLSYFHFAGEQGCVAWICADEAGEREGAPYYLRGSHRWHRSFAPNVFLSHTALPGSEGELLSDLECDTKPERIRFDVTPGDIVVHHFLTVHGAGGNRTMRPRRAVSLRYAGERVSYQRRPGAPEQPYHMDALADGDPLDSRQYPVVWPKPFPSFKLAPVYDHKQL